MKFLLFVIIFVLLGFVAWMWMWGYRNIHTKIYHSGGEKAYMKVKRPTDYQCCVLCNKPFEDSLRYPRKSGKGWAHWHCIMNQNRV